MGATGVLRSLHLWLDCIRRQFKNVIGVFWGGMFAQSGLLLDPADLLLLLLFFAGGGAGGRRQGREQGAIRGARASVSLLPRHPILGKFVGGVALV